MARDIPFKPRFYIDHLQYIRHSGILPIWDFDWMTDGSQDVVKQSYIGWRDSYSYQNEGSNYYLNSPNKVKNMFDFNPTKYTRWNYSEDLSGTGYRDNTYQWFWIYSGIDKISDWEGKWYYGALGHNMYNNNTKLGFRFSKYDGSSGSANVDGQSSGYSLNSKEIINNCESPEYNGFSLNEIKSSTMPNDDMNKWIDFRLNVDGIGLEGSLNDLAIGTITFGKIFDLSISSDLKMTMSYEYGTKGKESKGGGYLSSIDWWQKPLWANSPAWELDQVRYDTDYLDVKKSSNNWRKSGRRVYDLSFTFLTSDELLATSGVLDGTTLAPNIFNGDTTADLTDEREDGSSASVADETTPISIINDHSFFSQVIHKTMGFHLPFIFHPNSTYCKPDGFMIARVDSRKGFQLEQLAPDLWRCKLRIKEVW